MNTISIPIDRIDIGDRLRQVDPAEVERLAVSMDETGQLQPVAVREIADGTYRLVIGGHRVTAAVKLGWTTISASVIAGTDDEARLAEIDENLYRRELSPYDQATFLDERREVCQRLGLIAKHTGQRKSAKFALSTFEEELATKFGISRRLLFLALRRRRNIHPGAWNLLARTPLADKGNALDLLADVQREKQIAAVQRFLAPLEPGERKRRWADICREANGALPPKSPASRGRRMALSQAWTGADWQDREWWVRQLPQHERDELLAAIEAVATQREAA